MISGKYTHMLGSNEIDGNPPGFLRVFDPAFYIKPNLPKMSYEEALMSVYRVRKWEMRLDVDVTLVRPESSDIDWSGRGFATFENQASSESKITSHLYANAYASSYTGDLSGSNGFPRILFDENLLDNSSDPRTLACYPTWNFIQFEPNLSVGDTGASDTERTQIGVCPMEFCGLSFDIPIRAISVASPNSYSVTFLDSYLRAVEYWSYGGKYNTTTGAPL